VKRLREVLLGISDKLGSEVTTCLLGAFLICFLIGFGKLITSYKIVMTLLILLALIFVGALICFGVGMFLAMLIFNEDKNSLYKFLGFDKSVSAFFKGGNDDKQD
jgi:ABC-type polysaccharide/polyol phosphate export permease